MKHILSHTFIFCGLLLFFPISLLAQNELEMKAAFTGVVTDEKGKPVTGASVGVQEKNVGTTTATDGSFTITAAQNDVLIIEKQGYLTLRHTLARFEPVAFTLKPALTDAGEEDDVIIPFGTRKKREVNTAITTVKTSVFPQIPLGAVTNVLSGRVPGLFIQQSGTTPGGDIASVQIRGRTTFGPGVSRVLVDGIQRTISDLELNEIESITLLKDAASLAWYGLRFGSGVILVTTKKGSATKSSLHFDAQTGWQIPEKIINPLNSYDYSRLYNEALTNDGALPAFDSATLNAYQNGTNPFKFPNNNYVSDFLKKSSMVQRYILSADGGNNTLRYFVMLGFYDQNGLFKNTKSDDYDSNIGFNRFNFRGNIDFDVNKNLTVGLNVGGRSENRRQPGASEAGSLLSLLYNTPPNAFPILNENGSYGGGSSYQSNPLGLIRDRGYTSTIDRVLQATLDVRQKLDSWTKGLSATINFSYDAQGSYLSGLNRDYEVVDESGSSPVVFRNKTPLSYRSAAFGASNRRNEVWAGFDYDRSFGAPHNLRASVRVQRSKSASPERLDLRTQGLSARADYSFKQKYYLGVVAGYSGSENFPPGKRYGFFPAISAGWVISDDALVKKGSFLNYLKLRASYGQAGTSEIGGARFPFETFFSRNSGGGGYVFGTGFSAANAAQEVSLANPNITWETISTVNAGVDIKLFKQSLSLSADVYTNHRTGILTQSAIPGVLGQTLIVNAGIVDSKGIDAAVTYEKKIGAVSLSFNGNILISDDEIIAENGQSGLPEYQRTIGRVTGSRLVFLSEGIFQTQAEINNSPRQTLGRVVPGDIKYKDVGGPNGKPDGVIDNFDRVRINERDNPGTYYGFGTNIRYKVFDLITQFQGSVGRTIDVQGLVNSGPFSLNEESLYRWTPATAATAKYPRLGISDRTNNTTASDFWLQSGDFIRLKYIELGVTVPPALSRKYYIKHARFYVGAFNLLTFDKLQVNADPEISGAGRGSAYPYLKTIYLGFRTSF